MKPFKPLKPNIVCVRFTDNQRAGLEHISTTRPGNMSEHIRQAVTEYLDRNLETTPERITTHAQN